MNTKSKWKSFSLLTGSILIMAVGIYFFKFANNFTFGGITGLAVLVAKTGVMSASDFTFLTNMLLLLLGFIVLGKKFGLKTAYCSTLLSVTLSLLERIYPMSHPLTDQPMLELTFAIADPSPGFTANIVLPIPSVPSPACGYLLCTTSITSFSSSNTSSGHCPCSIAFCAFCTSFALPTYAGSFLDKANSANPSGLDR